MKASLIARGERERWADHLPFVLLGIRSTLKEDISYILAELVYGTTLSLPSYLLVNGSASPVDLPSYVHDLLELFCGLKPNSPRISPRHGIFVSPDLQNCTHVYIRRNAFKPPLTPPYDGLFPVLEHSAKRFTVDIGGRLKPAFFAANISLAPHPYDNAEPPSPITRKKTVSWDLGVCYNRRSSSRLGGELCSGQAIKRKRKPGMAGARASRCDMLGARIKVKNTL